jgi:hypothetical protein
VEDLKDLKFGIIVTRWNGGRRHIGICHCGQHILTATGFKKYDCDNCGNTYFIDAGGRSRNRFTIPLLEVMEKNRRGFKVKRTNLSVEYDKDNGVKALKRNLTREIHYDVVDEVLKTYRNGELEFDFQTQGFSEESMKEANRFFVQLDEDDFIEQVTNDENRELISCVSSLSGSGYQKKQTIKGLATMFQYQYLQILANAGIANTTRFLDRRHYGNILNKEKTKPHEILQVPKYMMPYIREDVSINLYTLSQLQSGAKRVDGNKFKEIMSIVKDESDIRTLANVMDNIMQLHVDYEYTNLRKLCLYIFREARLNQGITSPSNVCQLLRDYIRMSRDMNLEYEKYPKSLKKEHDITQMNYKVKESEHQKKSFAKAIEKKSYQELIYKHRDYVILAPEQPDDLVREGNQLSHCVASYVKDVSNDRCKILFLRKLDNMDAPVATIEVRGINIRQARGRANRALKQEEREFITAWAKKKNLVEAYY